MTLEATERRIATLRKLRAARETIAELRTKAGSCRHGVPNEVQCIECIAAERDACPHGTPADLECAACPFEYHMNDREPGCGCDERCGWCGRCT